MTHNSSDSPGQTAAVEDEKRTAPLSTESLQQIKVWLSPTDSDTPASEYKKHLNSHAAGTGEWILETEQYRQWSESKVGNLWIRGIPGCGKSVVAASFISRFRRLQDGPVLFFFFREIIQANRSPRSLMQDFCHEMLEYSPWLQSQLNQIKAQHSSVGAVPYKELWKCMATAMGSIGKVHCVVDALDEMEQGNDQFFQDLLDLGRQSSGSIKLIITSRQVPHVEKHLKGTSLVDLRLDRRNVDRDIAVYITQRLVDAHLKLPDEKIEEVKQTICDRGQGLFLYSRLMLDQLLLHPESMSINIKKLPDGLGDMYTELLRDHAIRSGTSTEFQKFILQWITHSARPLRLLELAVMVDSLPDRCGLSESQDAKLAIRTTCGPLLEVCEDGVIQIIHHSLTEFVLNRDVTHTQMSNHERGFSGFHAPTVHGMITKICVNYLSSGCLDGISTEIKRPSEDDGWAINKELALRFYFLRYAIVEWPFHASRAVEFDEGLLPFLENFCTDGNHSYEAWKKLWSYNTHGVPKTGSSLHIAAYCGIPAFARYLLLKGVNPDSGDSRNETPLMFAIERDHAEVITVLLEHGAKHDVCDEKDLVLYATKKNHAKSLQALIKGGVPIKTYVKSLPESEEKFPCDVLGGYVTSEGSRELHTPFEFACYDGHLEAVQELMKHLDSLYLCNGFLHLASKAGKSKVVGALLEDESVRGTINLRDSNGNTPLYLAAKQRDYETVKTLLEHGADVTLNSMNLNHPPRAEVQVGKLSPGWTESMDFATTILDRGANAALLDCQGSSPLHFPQLTSNIAEALVNSGADINSARDSDGLTPLMLMASSLSRIELSLWHEMNVDFSRKDHQGQTAFHHCFRSRLSDTNKKDIVPWINAWCTLGDLNARDNFGRTPLLELLFRNGNNWTDGSHNVQIIQQFIKNGASLEDRDFSGQTALLTALNHPDLTLFSLVDEILRLGGDAKAVDNEGASVGKLMKKEERGEVLDFVLGLSKDLEIDARDSDGCTPLHYASTASDIHAHILIQRGADILAEDHQKRTALHLAAEAGQSNIVGLILESYEQNQWSVNKLCSKGRSALHEACRAGCQESVQMLLDAGADPRIQDQDGKTPLHAAAEFRWPKSGNVKEAGSDATTRTLKASASMVTSGNWDAVSQTHVPGEIFRDIRQVVALLISAEGETSIKDKNGYTASDVAASLACFPVFGELQNTAPCATKPKPTLYDSPLSFIRKEALAVKTPDAWTSFLQKIVSTGDGRLVEEILRANQLKISGPDGESLMSLVASRGLASMMDRMIPYVEDFASIGSQLLESATSQRSCNTQMVKVLVKHLTPAEDKSLFVASVNHLVQSEAWWYPQALSILLDSGADPNLGGQSTTMSRCLNFGTSGDPTRRSEKWNTWGPQLLDLLLKNGADPNELKIALQAKRDVKILKSLVDHGADVSKASDILSVTLSNRDIDLEALESILELGVDPNGTDSERPLFRVAGVWNCEKAVSILLRYGADPHASMEGGKSTVLHEICSKGGILKPILVMGIECNTRDAQGRTPLMRACMCTKDRSTNVADLIQAGASPDLVDDTDSTALHHAARCWNEKAVEELLNHCVDISPRDCLGVTPLCDALGGLAGWCNEASKYFPMIEALLDAGANPLDVLSDGRGALHCVAVPLMNASNEDRQEQIAQYYGKDYFGLASGLYQRLLKAGCDPELRDHRGRTPIFCFVDADKSQFWDFINAPIAPFNPEDCQKMFSEHDIHTLEYSGGSLLHAIARREEGECDGDDHDEKLFSMLVDMGLDPWKENDEGQTALDIASVTEKSGILALFARED
ncbi:hypothetical protein N7541_004812 [Penicillium brevicompactum]|uniref:NACHT domain-containing protein n=1 Tax=Penicillium brevicompactum TaxID=5074 RepID=A0A9W9UV30_PENBR|nr:hypothetical protein N7541_004812 [Penicillium brevicompactum]